MRKFILAAMLTAAASLASAAEPTGPWRVETSAFGVTVTNGTNTAIKVPDQKSGEEVAEALNDAQGRADKKDKPAKP